MAHHPSASPGGTIGTNQWGFTVGAPLFGVHSGDDGALTLAFSLEAVKRLSTPEKVFTDARTWSQHIGIISDDPRAVDRYAREHDLTQDFFTGEHGKRESLTLVISRFETDRYVFLGTTDDDQWLANTTGWEYLPIEEAALKADWELVAPDGMLARLTRFIRDLR